MAESKKATGKGSAKNLGEITEFSSDPAKNENVKLSKEEELAIEVQRAAAQGDDLSGKFKLADPKTSYQDREFTLAEDQEKELPKEPSPELIARIRSGFIVKA